jgi:hypothetical protein
VANALYDKGREAFLGSTTDANLEVRWDSDDIKLQLINETDDVPVLATDDYYDDIAAAARPTGGTSGNLASKTSVDGVADAADLSPAFTAAAQGPTSDTVMESFSIYKDSGVEATSVLIANIDTAGGTLPVTVNTGNIDVTWQAASPNIFKL